MIGMAGLATGQPEGGDRSFVLASTNNFPEFLHPKSPTKQTTTKVLDATKDDGKAICVEEKNNAKMKYVDLNKPTVRLQYNKTPQESIKIKAVGYNDGVPRITWIEEEVQKMNVIEKLQFGVIGKFSYGWQAPEEWRLLIPKQFKVK